MTTKLEEQFFNVFGIEPLRHVCYRVFDNCIDNDYNCHCHNKKPCEDSLAIYPEITDRKLLEMICILVKTQTSYPINKSNIKDIKYEVLQRCVNLKSYIKQQIQQLFKEGE